MTYTHAAIAACAAVYGLQLHVPAGIDGPRLMLAISGEESGYGANCGPRHEPAYDVGGAYATHAPMPQLLALFGSAAACSYGPWQTLLCVVPTYTPSQLDNDLDHAATAFVAYFNSYVMARRPQTVAQIAEIYNSGHISSDPAPGVLKYVAAVTQYYLSAVLPAVSNT